MRNLLLPFLCLAGLLLPAIQTEAANTPLRNNMDVTPPVFAGCLSGLVTLCTYVNVTQNPLTFLTTWPIPTATDDSGQVTVVQTAGPSSGVTYLFQGVVYTVSYKATDPSGNSTSCTFMIKVDDEPPALANCPGNLILCSGNDSWQVPTATDNCGQATIVQIAGPASGTMLSPGITYTVGYKASDQIGNSTSCIFTVLVADNEPPNLTCSNQTISFNGQSSIVLDKNALVTATDNCGIQSITLSPSVIPCAQLGQVVPVTATVTDINGNTVTCTSNITVTGMPCGWSQNPNGINCPNGSNSGYNPMSNVWTVASTYCYYANPFTNDALAFAQRSLCGDGSITAQVTGIGGGSALGWAGVMMREGNAAGAKKAQLMTNLSSLSRREFRTTTNGAANPQQFPSQDRYWLRIVRTGHQFGMYVSSNGQTWSLVGTQNIAMANCIEIGLVATNYTANSTVTATFANVDFTVNIVPLIAPDAHALLESPGFSVFPNPASGTLNLDLSSYTGKAVRIELYDVQGQLLQFTELDNLQEVTSQLNLSGYHSGMYLVKLTSPGLPDAAQRVVLTR